MLCLSRVISDIRPEWVNIHINYADNANLVKVIESLGGNSRMRDNIVETIHVQPVKMAGNEIVLGFTGARHVKFVRSEIDTM